MINMLQKYSYCIFNHCDYYIHTNKLKGFNNKIKVIKGKAHGFLDDGYFILENIQPLAN
ncbi:MAG: transposase [Candidatus Scalindua sp.]|nr:transposase [Candidatus Scalindua sp.]